MGGGGGGKRMRGGGEERSAHVGRECEWGGVEGGEKEGGGGVGYR